VDTDIIQRLLALMDEGGLTELLYEKDDVKVKLSRRQDGGGGYMMAGMAPAMAQPMAAGAAPVVAAAAAPAAVDEGLETYNSPMVGTFYRRANPESEAFVSVGDSVGPETVLCIIEAMKVFNEIKAEMSGEIVKVLVKDGETIEFDQPLFKVRTA
jgi:acetyl-CoA carboxylase biotin carboxyl carrier protein